jgi:hypothetical protein
MERPLPEYIEERIRRRPPDGLPVVPGSTPVIAFGDARKAWVATLGWNPSKLEFIDKKGKELAGPYRRLETLTSLALHDLSVAPPDVILKVFPGCNAYFQRAPYRRWFNVLEELLQSISASYYDGTACHLDFVQWSTDPVWRDLQRTHRDRLIEADLAFLRQQLVHESIRLLLLNGSGIAREFSKPLAVPLAGSHVQGRQPGKLFAGRMAQGTQVIGWNLNLQSSFGVSNEYIASVSRAIARRCADV